MPSPAHGQEREGATQEGARVCLAEAQMAPRRAAQPAHGARAETGRQALLLAVQALGVNAERVQEAERKQAEAERERDVAVQLLVRLLGKLEDAEVQKQDVLVLAACKGSTAVVEELLKDDDVDKDGELSLIHI